MNRASAGALAALLATAAAAASDYPIAPVPFTAVHLDGGLWQARQEINRTVTVPYALQKLEESGRLRNFDLAAETLRRRAAGEASFQNTPATKFPFDDSDVYKVIEGAAYSLSAHPDPALEGRLDRIIARIAAAQESDGYLYTFRTMHPDSPVQEWINPMRWLNDPTGSHELYDAGHLYEAGVAYFQATGKRELLDVCLRNADLVCRDLGSGTPRIAPGHEEIEMGLVKLYRETARERYLGMARIFLENRGPGGKDYNQDRLRVVDQREATGHAVRANYLYSGMADVAALAGDPRYVAAISAIWGNMAGRKLYLTGGVGALAEQERYGADYELPNNGYCESCAAIALMMWNHRMFLLTGDSRYMDVLERSCYNGVLSGVSQGGDRFFYTNPCVYDGQSRNNGGFAGRAPWFSVSCCPTNEIRTLADLSGYFYGVRGDVVYVNLYGQSEADVALGGGTVRFTQTTDYPWNARVTIGVAPSAATTFTLRLRVPGWELGRPVPTDLYGYDDGRPGDWSLAVNGRAAGRQLAQGYVSITRTWRAGDTVDLNLPMPVRRVHGNPRIEAARGRVAFERGPIVYCVEGAVGGVRPEDLVAPEGARIVAAFHPELLGGVETLTLGNATERPPVTAIPYYSWDNRGLAPMAVWLRRAAD